MTSLDPEITLISQISGSVYLSSCLERFTALIHKYTAFREIGDILRNPFEFSEMKISQDTVAGTDYPLSVGCRVVLGAPANAGQEHFGFQVSTWFPTVFG